MARRGIDRRGMLTAAGIGGLLAGAPGQAFAKPGGSGGARRLATPPEAVVETRAGKLRGVLRDGVYAYKGVPYGRDTGGAARFLPPQPAAPWTGVRSALAYGPCCPQVVRGGWKSDETAFIYDWDDGFPGEDCLRLNLWSAGVGRGARPVMIWIHGGGYEAGSSQELPAYDGERLARRGDLVVVSVNHRLGPFGFLDLSGFGAPYAASGNAGMQDLVLALEWVRDNIVAFGGDPRNVTIFGQSGGGAKVSTLMAMPAAKGLFHKAIVQSGSQLRVQTPENAGQISVAVLKALGIAPGELGKLAQVPAPALVDAGEAARKAVPKALLGTPSLLWQPVMDGSVIPAQTWTPGAPALSAHVPLMVGSNLNEYSPSLGSPALEEMKDDQARAMAGAIAGEKGAAAWPAYRAANPGAKPVEVLSRLVSAQFRVPAVEQARLKATLGGAPAFLYRFDYQPALLDGRVRAFHCAELAYCFDNVDRCLNATGGTPEARALAGRMADAWIAFARTGNPNHKGLPHWPPVGAGAVPNMIFDAQCMVQDDPDRAERQALG